MKRSCRFLHIYLQLQDTDIPRYSYLFKFLLNLNVFEVRYFKAIVHKGIVLNCGIDKGGEGEKKIDMCDVIYSSDDMIFFSFWTPDNTFLPLDLPFITKASYTITDPLIWQ